MRVNLLENLVVALRVNVNKMEPKLVGGRVLSWNAPVILAFTVMVFLVHLSYQTSYSSFIEQVFTVGRPSSWTDLTKLFNIFTYVFFDGGRWGNVAAPMMLIVVVGPIVEERIGSLQLAIVMAATAAITGVLYALLFSYRLYGPTCLAYLLVFLASFVNVKKGETPVSFLLVIVVLILVGAEQWIQNFQNAFPMIIGAVCGMLSAKLTRPIVR